MSNSSNRLGELLVREKLISLQQLKQAQQDQVKSGKNLSYTLSKLGYISDGEITDFLSSQYRLPAVNLEDIEIEEDVLKLLAREVCEKHRVLPISRSGSSLIVAMADPTNLARYRRYPVPHRLQRRPRRRQRDLGARGHRAILLESAPPTTR